MKSLLLAVAAATLLVASVSSASAFNMNVPKSVMIAAVEAPTVSTRERSFAFPPLTFLSVAGDYAARLRSEVIDVFAPGIFAGIGAAYHRALAAPATSAVPELISI